MKEDLEWAGKLGEIAGYVLGIIAGVIFASLIFPKITGYSILEFLRLLLQALPK